MTYEEKIKLLYYLLNVPVVFIDDNITLVYNFFFFDLKNNVT